MSRCAAAVSLALSASLVATALAAGTAVTLGSAQSSRLGERIVVSGEGRTLYTLSPETSSHLLCKSSECLKFWPPVTVRSRSTTLKAGSGVHGRLGILRRSNGLLQVTLRGLPLYRYSRDHARGQLGGEAIESFGGTWHAVAAASNAGTHTMTSPPPTTPSPAPAYPSPPAYPY